MLIASEHCCARGHVACPRSRQSGAIRQADDQQLMTKTDLGATHDQADFAHTPELGVQPLASDRFTVSNPDSWIVQKTAQPAGGAQQLGRSRDLYRRSGSDTPTGSQECR